MQAGGNFGAWPNPPLLRVEAAFQRANRAAEQRGGERLGRRRLARGVADRVGERLRLPVELPAAVRERIRDGEQHLAKARQPVARLGREVGAAEERPPLRIEEHGHRPAAVAREREHGLHVEPVHVGPLLAVDLDAHETLVHERRGLGVLEGLVLHDVAPVAGRVADREEDRQVVLACAREGLVAPGEPVHGVSGVLEEVRAGLAGEPVHPVSVRPTAGRPTRARTPGTRRPRRARRPSRSPGRTRSRPRSGSCRSEGLRRSWGGGRALGGS